MRGQPFPAHHRERAGKRPWINTRSRGAFSPAWPGVPLGPGHLKRDLVTFIQGLEARLFHRGVVDEDIWTIVLRHGPKLFVRIKPLHDSMGHGMILLIWG